MALPPAAFKREITDTQEAALNKLKLQYQASIEAAIAKASDAGDLDGALALRSEQNASRPVLEGETHSGWHIELHESALQPGGMPHPPHHHVHEEMFLVREGTLEVTIAGQTSRLGPGSVAFVASNDEHGVRNVGRDHAQYFVLALGRDRS